MNRDFQGSFEGFHSQKNGEFEDLTAKKKKKHGFMGTISKCSSESFFSKFSTMTNVRLGSFITVTGVIKLYNEKSNLKIR